MLIPLVTNISGINFEYSREYIVLLYSEIIFTLFVSIFIFLKNQKKFTSWGLLTFLSYLIILLIFFSTDKAKSAKNLMNFSREFLLLPASFLYFLKYSKFEKMIRIFLVLNVISIFYTIFSSIFNIGFNPYGTSIIQFGGLGVFGGYFFVYSVPLLLWIISTKKINKTFIYLLITINIIIPILTFKRTYILLIVISIIFYLYFNLKAHKSHLALGILLFITIGLYLFNFQINEMIRTREERINTRITEEGRYIEYLIIYNELLNSANIKKMFIGNELFNNQGAFGQNSFFNLDTTKRFLHGDYAEIIFSTGIIGTLLYAIFFYKLHSYYNKLSRKLEKNEYISKYLFVSILIMVILNGISDGLFVFVARGYPFFILGFILAYISNKVNSTIQT